MCALVRMQSPSRHHLGWWELSMKVWGWMLPGTEHINYHKESVIRATCIINHHREGNKEKENGRDLFSCQHYSIWALSMNILFGFVCLVSLFCFLRQSFAVPRLRVDITSIFLQHWRSAQSFVQSRRALSHLKSSMFVDQTRKEMRGEGRESASARER